MNSEFSVNIQPGAGGDTEMFDFDFDTAMSTSNSPSFHPTNSNGSNNDITAFDFDLNKTPQIISNTPSSSAAPIDIAYQKTSDFGFRSLQNQQNNQQNNQTNLQNNQLNNNITNTNTSTTSTSNLNQSNNHNNTTSNNNIVFSINNQNLNQFLNNPRLRRESIAHTQGMGGVSFGSLTIGSWLKDEVLFHHNGVVGSSQQPHGGQQSSQQHTGFSLTNNGQYNNLNSGMLNMNSDLMMTMSPPQANYLPNLEADYCKDYSCCGHLLPTLHDLLRHYEEAHISISPPADVNISSRGKNGKMRSSSELMEGVSTNEVFLSNNNNSNGNINGNLNKNKNLQNISHMNQLNNNNINLSDHQTTSNLSNHLNNNLQNQRTFNDVTNNSNDTLFNFNSHLVGALTGNTNTTNASGNFTNNMSMNKPAFNTGNFNNGQLDGSQQHGQSNLSANFNNLNSASGTNTTVHGRNYNANVSSATGDEDEICIDDPARHLYVDGENRPFKCPVIGCDKTYKNQNGLKYHKAHGHQNQKLFENPDGTFSVIDPESNQPYPDGNFNMEKDKPYRCEVCGKRYKNLNGLKYHRGHSTH